MSTVLSNMVQTLIEVPSVRLLKHIVRCYLRLSENPRCVCGWLIRLLTFSCPCLKPLLNSHPVSLQ